MYAENTTYSEDFITQAAITLTSASLSLLGVMILIFTNLLISEFQTFVHRLLVFLTFVDILSAFGYILGTVYIISCWTLTKEIPRTMYVKLRVLLQRFQASLHLPGRLS